MKVGDNLYLFACVCGQTLCSEPDTFIECCQERLDQLLSERHHVIQFTDTGWVIAHPLRERMNGSLFECPAYFWTEGDPRLRGRFILNDDGTVGDRLAEEA